MKNYLQRAVHNDNVIFIIMFLVSCCLTLSTSAQNRDTSSIYYMLDTVNTPVADRLWKIYQQGPYIFFDINCPCLTNGGTPTMNARKEQTSSIDYSSLKNKKLITLPDLLKRLRDIYLKPEDTPPPVYIIQKTANGYSIIKTNILLINRKDISY